MASFESSPFENGNRLSKIIRSTKFLVPVVGFGIVVGIIILSLSIATLAKVDRKFHEIEDNGKRTTLNAKVMQKPLESTLAASILIEEVMSYLNELQRIATVSNNTRAINTPGFNATLNFISNYLTANTNYKVTKSFFFVRDFALASSPTLTSSIDGVTRNYTYKSTDISTSDFYYVKYSTSTRSVQNRELSVIPNVGCTDEDWQKASPPPQGRVVLVKRGVCLFRDKSILAEKYKVAAVLLYNDGTAPDRIAPIEISLAQNNTVPALFLSFTVGQALVNAAQDPSKNSRVQLFIDAKDLPDFPVGNICADTPSGNVTQTIVIGSHTDSVPAGPGVNDNGTIIISAILFMLSLPHLGSGSAANLALAATLARLFRTSTYPKYKYRVRFCWWGAEEVGLLGSDHHVKQAKKSTVVGERLSDYLINLNYDMLGSPNYFFGIYDGRTARNDTPSQALAGSNKITALFKDWFISQNLPWDYTDFSGRSDYGPFLAEGIVAGGLFSGADEAKRQEQRDRYDQMLGQGMGGIPGIVTDPCYHKACDSIQNINVFAYEKMVRAAAYALEFLGRQEDLMKWLYPTPRTPRSSESRKNYNSVNEYFGLPYL